MKFRQATVICHPFTGHGNHKNTTQRKENRTGRRHTTAIGADGKDGGGAAAGPLLPDARELARAEPWTGRGRVAGLHPERGRPPAEFRAGLGGGAMDDLDGLLGSAWPARARLQRRPPVPSIPSIFD